MTVECNIPGESEDLCLGLYGLTILDPHEAHPDFFLETFGAQTSQTIQHVAPVWEWRCVDKSATHAEPGTLEAIASFSFLAHNVQDWVNPGLNVTKLGRFPQRQ